MGKTATIILLMPHKVRLRSHTAHRAFTLVEMLAVMGIMLTMLGLVLPAINDALGSRSRKGAVNISRTVRSDL